MGIHLLVLINKIIRRTRAKLVVKKRVGPPLISKVKLEVSLRGRLINAITRVTGNLNKKRKIKLLLRHKKFQLILRTNQQNPYRFKNNLTPIKSKYVQVRLSDCRIIFA